MNRYSFGWIDAAVYANPKHARKFALVNWIRLQDAEHTSLWAMHLRKQIKIMLRVSKEKK